MTPLANYFKSLFPLHWVVICLSLGLTISAWHISSRNADQKARAQFDQEVSQLNELLRDRFRLYELALTSGTGAIRASGGDVDLTTWRAFSKSLAIDERLPGINGIGVIERVAPEDRGEFIGEKKQERSYFDIHPKHNRDDLWPIVYIEPEAANRKAVGLDMAHETNRYQAALKAMTSGQPQITGPIVLVQDEKKTPGFLFFHPFYETPDVPPPQERESRFLGLVYAPFIVNRLMEGTLAEASRLLHFRVKDGDTEIYSEMSEPKGENFDSSPMFQTSFVTEVYGRDWRFDVQTTRLFQSLYDSSQPLLILVGGLIINGFILGIFAALTNANRNSKRIIKERTKELQDSLNFIENLADNLPLAVSVWDSSLHCRFMNAYGERWFPLKKAAAVGRPLSDFIGENVVDQRRPYYDRVIAGEPVQFKTTVVDNDGKNCKVLVSYYPVMLGGEHCFMATTLDITDLVERENQLRELNAELEKQREKAESAAKVKTNFLANMSHEIRTPMNAIIGVLVMLQDAGLDRHPRRLVNKAYSAAEALLHLLNDVLDLSKIEADRINLRPQPFSIDALVHRSVDVFAIAAEEKGLRLRVAVDPKTPDRLIGDLLRISQICTNLIGNAIKFTREGQVEVRFGFEPNEPSQGTLVIEIEDSGIGISVEDQKRIFDSFRQADEASGRNYGGTGLGLSISKKLAEIMGGTLTLDSRPNKGAKFRVWVPADIPGDASMMGASDIRKPIRVLHHGLGHNLRLLNDYRDHWRLNLEPVTDLSEWPTVLANIKQMNESADCFFIIDTEKADIEHLQQMLDDLTNKPGTRPIWAVMLIVPAGYSEKLVEEFQRLGGKLLHEPLTPSLLYEHFAQRHWSKADTSGALQPRFPDLCALVVDDMPLNCEIVETYLQSFGVECHTALNGRDALKILKQKAVDLVLMDLHLDGETGQDVARQIQTADTVNQPIIVALSASIAEKDRLSAKQAGMEDYLTKPVVPSDIQLLLETFFEPGRTERSELPKTTEPVDVDSQLPAFISRPAYQRLFGDEPGLFDRCARSFVASAGDIAIEAHGCKDLKDIWKLAHKVKGAAANLGDLQLESLASQVEEAEDFSIAQQELSELVSLIKSHAETLEAAFPRNPENQHMPTASDDVRKALEQVRAKLTRSRIPDDALVDVIIGHLIQQDRPKLAAQLRQHLEAYDFGEAITLLDKIIVKELGNGARSETHRPDR